MRVLQKLSLGVIALFLCAQFVACGGGGSNGGGNNNPTLQSIGVSPATKNLITGQTQQYSATGNYSDGSTKNLTSTANWASSDTAIASVSVTGLATAGSKAGNATISATFSGVTGSATLSVAVPVLVSMAVTPPSATVDPTHSQQFTATGTYSDQTTKDITSAVTWSAPTGVTITAAGLATGVTPGTYTIGAALGGITATASLTVTNPVVSIAVTPANQSIAVDTSIQFTATATLYDQTQQNITQTASWTSSDATIATVGNTAGSKGLAKGVAAGTVTIQAASGAVTGSTSLKVKAVNLLSIDITPPNATISLRDPQAYTATGHFSDGSSQNISLDVTWSSSAPAVATITTGGFATGVGVGATTIGAQKSGISATATLTVNADNLVSIAIAPNNANSLTLAKLTSQGLTATGTLLNGSTLNITSLVAWSSSDTSVASVGLHTGVVKALAKGSSTITAALSPAPSATLALTVSDATIQSVTVTPLNPSIAKGTKLNFTATGGFSDGSTQIIDNDCSWTSNNTGVATVVAGGTATGVSAGTAQITATFQGVGGSATLTVTNANLNSISITPQSGLLAPSTSLAFTAIGTYSDNTTQNVTTLATWNSSSPGVVSISSSGVATGQEGGQSQISASIGQVKSNAATVVVEASQLTALAVNPQSASVPANISTSFTAQGTFADGTTQNLTSAATWSSSSAGVATVSNSNGKQGVATGVSPGNTTISAVFGGITANASLAVNNLTLTSITVSPPTQTIKVGQTVTYTATGHFNDGSSLNLTSQVTWSSDTPAVAVVAPNGVATGASPGIATITATLNGQSGGATLTVTN